MEKQEYLRKLRNFLENSSMVWYYKIIEDEINIKLDWFCTPEQEHKLLEEIDMITPKDSNFGLTISTSIATQKAEEDSMTKQDYLEMIKATLHGNSLVHSYEASDDEIRIVLKSFCTVSDEHTLVETIDAITPSYCEFGFILVTSIMSQEEEEASLEEEEPLGKKSPLLQAVVYLINQPNPHRSDLRTAIRLVKQELRMQNRT